MVLSEECDECEPKPCAKMCPDLDFVVRIVGVDADVIELIYARYVQLRRCIRSRL